MALHAARRVNPAVDLMLAYIVAPVRHGPLRRILVLVARLEFFPVRVAIGTEGFLVAYTARSALLLSKEPVPVRVVARMVQCCPPIGVAIAADRESRDFYGVHCRHAAGVGAGVYPEQQHKNRQQHDFWDYSFHVTPPLWSRIDREA